MISFARFQKKLDLCPVRYAALTPSLQIFPTVTFVLGPDILLNLLRFVLFRPAPFSFQSLPSPFTAYAPLHPRRSNVKLLCLFPGDILFLTLPPSLEIITLTCGHITRSKIQNSDSVFLMIISVHGLSFLIVCVPDAVNLCSI